ncbi:ADP-ribosylation factor-related protein 1 [Hordeum vulgare]|nr:ADP-ribosylation factor-related protein 1 [Hordeum vulgare]
MGLWNYGRKGKHDREAGSSSGRRPGSVKEEAASPPRRASAPAPFTIGPRPAGQRDQQYLSVVVCRRYWKTRTPVSWSDVHLPNNWHLSANRVPIPSVPTSGRARRDEIERRHRLLPDDLYYDDRYAADSVLWDTWLRDEHDVRRASYFADTGGARPHAHAIAFPVSVTTSTSSHDNVGGGPAHATCHGGLHDHA